MQGEGLPGSCRGRCWGAFSEGSSPARLFHSLPHCACGFGKGEGTGGPRCLSPDSRKSGGKKSADPSEEGGQRWGGRAGKRCQPPTAVPACGLEAGRPLELEPSVVCCTSTGKAEGTGSSGSLSQSVPAAITKISLTGWLIDNRNLFLSVLEAGSLRPGEGPPLASHCIPAVEGSGSSVGSLSQEHRSYHEGPTPGPNQLPKHHFLKPSLHSRNLTYAFWREAFRL